MAIIVERPRPKKNIFAILTVILIVGFLFTGIYFLFFRKSPLIEIIVPVELKDISRLSEVRFNPRQVLENPVFKNLRQYAPPLTIPSPGRANPFLAP